MHFKVYYAKMHKGTFTSLLCSNILCNQDRDTETEVQNLSDLTKSYSEYVTELVKIFVLLAASSVIYLLDHKCPLLTMKSISFDQDG